MNTVESAAFENVFDELGKVTARAGKLALRGRLDQEQIGTLADDLKRITRVLEELAGRW